MALYQELSPPSLRNGEPKILELTSVSKSPDVCKANNDLQRFVNANSISMKRNKQLPKSFMITKLSPLSKLISKRCRYFKLRHERIILFQGMVKKKKINIFIFLLYNSKEQTLSKEIIKIRRYLISITSTNVEKVSKYLETYTCNLPKEVKDRLRKNILRTNENDTNKNYDKLTKPTNKCLKYRTSHPDMDKLEGSILSCNISKHLQLCNNSLTKINQNANLFEMENSSFPLYVKEEFYLVKRIYFVYIMSRSKKCLQDPTSSKKLFCGKDHYVSSIFKQTCKVHNDLMIKTARPCCGNHRGSMSTVMESIIKKRRCIERDYENMLRQISRLMHTCKDENKKLKNISHLCLPKKNRCKTEIVPHCKNCKKTLRIKPKNTVKQKCMNNFGKIIKRTFNRCSRQAKSALKRINLGKKIKYTCGECSSKATTKFKSIHLDRIIKKLCGQCSRKVASTLKSKSKHQDCYMFSVHVLPTLKTVCEPEICHFKENAVYHFWSIMNPEKSNILNCAAISKRGSKIENDTSTCEKQRRNCLKSKLLLVKKRTSVVLLDVNNFAEYDICLQGMFKDRSKCSSNKTRKSISFDIPEDNNSSCSYVECSNSQHACCYQNFRDTDKPILDDKELANECKNKLCNTKTSPIKVKLPIPKCIDCTRDYKQCDMGLNTLPQNIEEECTSQINSKKKRILRRQKITPDFSPQCIIEIDNGNDLASLRLLDCAQQIKKSKKCKRKTNKKSLRPFWVKLFQKIKKCKVSKRKVCKIDSKELYKSFRKDVKNNDLLTFSDFKKMDKQQLIDIICELRKATSCDSTEEVETSSKSLSSDSYIGQGSKFSDDTTTSSSPFSSVDSGSNRKRSGINFSIPPNSVKPKNMDEAQYKYNLSKNGHVNYKNKEMNTKYEYVPQKFDGSTVLDTFSSETKPLIPKLKVFTSDYSQCEKFSSKCVKNIYWRCATKDGKKKKKRNKLTKVEKPRMLKQQIIKCHLSSHRVMRLRDKQQERIRDFDNNGKNLSSVHSLECIQSLTDYENKIEYHRPFWFKKYSHKSNIRGNQQSQACDADIEEQWENVEDHNAQANETTFSVFELRTEKQIKHIIYEVENATWSYHSSVRKKGSTQTYVKEDEPRNLVLSEDIELTFSDFETMDETQLTDIICQLQNSMLSSDSFAGNLRGPPFEINDKQCGDDDRLTFRDFQGMSIREPKDTITELETMSFFDCDTSNSSAMDVETTYKSESSSSSCVSAVHESVPSAVYTLSTYNSDVECNHAGFNFLIRPNNANIHKFFRIFRIK